MPNPADDAATGAGADPVTAGHTIVFTPSGLRAVAAPGETVLDVARRTGVDIQSICGGRGLCGRCQIEVATGTHAKFAITVDEANLSPSGEAEARSQRRGVLRPGRRLACRAHVLGDVVIDVPADARVHGVIMAKAGTAIDLPLIPSVRLIMVTLPSPDLDDNPAEDRSGRVAPAAALARQERTHADRGAAR
jgi:uncharacterized 2Fe-2S/4Fe-4S cluster protein (DUF4445 family)